MIFTAKIEQTYAYPKRIKYIAASDSFIEKDGDSLSYVRGVKQPYGWITESGTPPCDHLDVIVMTDKEFALGDTVKVKIIGLFYRGDGDHKLVGVLTDRDIDDFSELSEEEKEDMHRLYPREDKEKGEGWYGREKAEKVIAEFFSKKKEKTIFTVQHTESQHHVNGMIGAWGDWELTERGKEQAVDIGKRLCAEGGNGDYIMYVSDLKRAFQTAEGINQTLGLTPVVTDVIREVNAGAGNGQPRDWYYSNKTPRPESYDPDYRPFPEAESDRDLWNRLYPFYQQIISNEQEKILVVSHGTALYFLQMMLMGYQFRDIERVRFDGRGGSVSKFTVKKDGKVTVNYINQSFF